MAMSHMDPLERDSDSEVSAVLQHHVRSTAGSTGTFHPLPSLPASLVQANIVKPSTGSSNTTQYIIEMDRSDEEESDPLHDPYAPTRGRVSPSPYTANTERARQFNAYVRGVIEQKLDIFVPISHQPREIISDIIADVSTKFPEFASCARKRIRTFLKSYRRSKKLKEGTGNGASPPNGLDDDELPHPHHSFHHHTHRHSPHPHQNVTSDIQGSTNPNTAVVTIIADPPPPPPPPQPQPATDSLMPEPKKMKLTPSLPSVMSKPPVIAGLMGNCSSNGGISHNSQSLSRSEVDAVKQLITGYRESAAFLQRAADQLEAMLHNSQSV